MQIGVIQPGIGQVSLCKIGFQAVAAVQCCFLKVGQVKHGKLQVAVGYFGPEGVGLGKVGRFQDAAVEVSIVELRCFKAGVVELGVGQDCFGQDGFVQNRSVQFGFDQSGPGQIAAGQVGAGQVQIAQFRSGKVAVGAAAAAEQGIKIVAVVGRDWCCNKQQGQHSAVKFFFHGVLLKVKY